MPAKRDDSGGWWNEARRDARALRARLSAEQNGEIKPDALLEHAVRAANLRVRARNVGDALLCGAHAVLDMEDGAIWIRADASKPERRLFVAHELAHFFLHGGQNGDLWQAGCFGDVAGGDDGLLVTVGYGPAQRRETEANVWAREFLLPAQTARAWFDGGETALQITRRVGLTLATIYTQLTASLTDLTDPETAAETSPATETIAAPPAAPPLTLDPTQEKAARTQTGPTLTHAGPGTGKTRTLAARVLFLTGEQAVRPENILVLTYGRKAAGELRERIALYAPETARRIFISTFHAYGYDLLRRFSKEAQLPPRPFLIEKADAHAFLERELAACDLQVLHYLHDPAYPLRDLLKTIAQAKEEGISPDELAARARENGEPKHEEAARVFAVYQAALHKYGALDYADLMHRSVRLLTENKAVRRAEQAQWKHVLVDEYQDVNRAGAHLLQLLTGDNGAGLWAVGDVRQAIYQFRGASPANVSRFDDDFPGGFRADLGVNYRSAPALVSLLGTACGEGQETWKSARQAGSPMLAPAVYAVAGDDQAQWNGIAQKMRGFVQTGSRWDDLAVLCRTNNQANEAAEALARRGIACAQGEGSASGGLLADLNVKNLLALMSRTCEADGAAQNQFPEISEAFLQTLPADPHLFLYEVLWGNLGWARHLTNPLPAGALLGIARSFPCRAALVMGTLAAEAEETEESRPAPDTRPAFLEHLRRMAFVGSASLAASAAPAVAAPDETGADAGVRVLTVHAAKGLEFPVVFVPNLSAGKFPSRPGPGLIPPVPVALDTLEESKSAPQPTVDREETRLFFVALSRAQNALFLTRAEKYNNRRAQPSPLLAGLEDAKNAQLLAFETWFSAASDPALAPQIAASSEDDTPEMGANAEAVTAPFVDAWEAELYLRCPRKYYFERVAGIATHAEPAPYQTFKRVLDTALAAPDAERAASALPDLWKSLENHVHEKTYRKSAEEIIARHFDAGGGKTPIPLAPLVAFVVERTHGSLVVRAENAGENGLLLRTYRKTPRTPTVGAELKHALLMEINPSVSVRYLQTGDVLPVKATAEARQKLLGRADRALRGISLRVFNPAPAEETECLACPYFFICT